LHLTDLSDTLSQQTSRASETAVLLASKVDQLNSWESQCRKVCEEVIPARLAQHLQPLRNSISAFVDENIERPNFGALWNREIVSLQLNEWAKAIQVQIIEETAVQLQEFARQLQADAEFLSFNVSSTRASFGGSDVKRTLKWISAGGSVLAGVAGVAAMIAGSNIWNPIGWIAAAIGIGGWVLSWFIEDRETKLQKQKRTTADELRTFVDKLEANVNRELLFWFSDKIASKEIRRVVADTEALRVGMDGMGRQLRAGARQLRSMVDALNVRVYSRAGAYAISSFNDCEVVSVARDPGVLGLAVVSARLARNGFASILAKVLNEKIIAVEDSDPSLIIEAALRQFDIPVDQVNVSESYVKVKLAPRLDRQPAPQHIALIARVLGIHIELEKSDND
jgi:hypothetical protein